MMRKSQALWRGNGRDGKGTLTSGSGTLSRTNFGYRSRFGDGPGTNPEELIAAAHAGCFAMAVAFGLQTAGFTADELQVESAVSLEPEGSGYAFTRSALTLSAKVPGIDDPRFQEIARTAEQTCPVSRLLNAEITLSATLLPS